MYRHRLLLLFVQYGIKAIIIEHSLLDRQCVCVMCMHMFNVYVYIRIYEHKHQYEAYNNHFLIKYQINTGIHIN